MLTEVAEAVLIVFSSLLIVFCLICSIAAAYLLLSGNVAQLEARTTLVQKHLDVFLLLLSPVFFVPIARFLRRISLNLQTKWGQVEAQSNVPTPPLSSEGP